MKQHLRILIAEDDPNTREFLNMGLTSLGHDVVGETAEGADLVEKCLALRPDLVLSDINMPGMDGIEAAQRILARDPTPIILISGYHDAELLKRVESCGAMGYLVKPIKSVDLEAAIMIAMRRFTELRQMRLDEKIHKAQRLESLNVMARGIAHDFNNLLTVILGNASLALDSTPTDASTYENLLAIAEAGQKAADLTRHLMTYTGQSSPVQRSLHLSKLVLDIEPVAHATIPKTIPLSFNLAEDLPLIEADPVQLEQAIMNLILNAADAIDDEEGRITIRTGIVKGSPAPLPELEGDESLPEGMYAYVEVSDTGRGMEPVVRSQIFDPFFSTKNPGRGLGLASVVGIVRSHHGAIDVASAPGQGSTLRLLFPCTGKFAAPISLHAVRRMVDLERVTALVVDDEPAVLDIACKILEGAGVSVLTARDGYEAVEVFRENVDRIDLVLLDVTMPRMSGDAAYLEIRHIRPDAKVILSSGYAEDQVVDRFLGHGVAGFIKKPYGAGPLLAKVREIMQVDIRARLAVEIGPMI
ncbi:MAG: response regulator [Planctomycetota bacterium]